MQPTVKYNWTESKTDKLGYTKASREGAYSRTKWIKLRNFVLDQYPLCSLCKEVGKVTPAEIVDHIKAIDGEDDPLFYELSNLRSLCMWHHRQVTRRDNSKYSKENIKRGKNLMDELSS